MSLSPFSDDVRGRSILPQKHMRGSDFASAIKLARDRRKSGQLSQARDIVQKVLEHFPEYLDAWVLLGALLGEQRDNDAALLALMKAQQLAPESPDVYNNLGNILQRLDRFEDARMCFDQALTLRPDFITALQNRGAANFWAGDSERALSEYAVCAEAAKDPTEFHFQLGMMQLRAGNFEQGWPLMENRLRRPHYTALAKACPQWQGEKLSGKRLLVICEQGLGDTIQFVRYLPMLRERCEAKTLVFACQKALHKLLRRVPGVDQWCVLEEPLPQADAHVFLMSLPFYLGVTDQCVGVTGPYLQAELGRLGYWRDWLDAQKGRVNIALAWRGNPAHNADARRSFSLSDMAPLGQLSDVSLIPLLKDISDREIDAAAPWFDLVCPGRELDADGAFLDTAALISSVDLIITCDTSLAHLAGALGRPVWLVIGPVADWRWGRDGGECYWYPNLRIFRREHGQTWRELFALIADKLVGEGRVAGWKKTDEYVVSSIGKQCIRRYQGGLLIYRAQDDCAEAVSCFGQYLPEQDLVVKQLLRPGNTVVEVGAGMGILTLTLAACVGGSGRVFAFEADIQNVQLLSANLSLNHLDTVQVVQSGLGVGAAAAPLPGGREPSLVRLLPELDGERPAIAITAIDQLSLKRCDLVVVSRLVEQPELALQEALASLKKYRPKIYVAMASLKEGAAVVSFLRGQNYRIFVHHPGPFTPDNYYRNTENVLVGAYYSHLVCVPGECEMSITGLQELVQ